MVVDLMALVFWSLDLMVTRDTLIPRPETEELVGLIIRENKAAGLAVLDIGTGSGCIAISLAKNMNQASVEAWDISEDALAIASGNNQLNRTNVTFRQVDVLNLTVEQMSAKFDIIVSNPPYVCEEEAEATQAEVGGVGACSSPTTKSKVSAPPEAFIAALKVDV